MVPGQDNLCLGSAAGDVGADFHKLRLSSWIDDSLQVAFKEAQGGLRVDTASNDHGQFVLLVRIEVLDRSFDVTISKQLQGSLIDLFRRGSLAGAAIHCVDLLAVEA